MSTPVAGSARLVCVPHNHEDPRTVFLSRNLASSILFCAPEVLKDGSAGSRYMERQLREGDFVMMERAPSLSKFNNQPLKLMFWDIECLGMHPKTFSHFHGDYDGDECHLYALGSSGSTHEAPMWKAPLDRNLCAAEGYMKDNFPCVYPDAEGEGDLKFLEYTTLSFREILEGKFELPMGNMVRVKKAHLSMFRERMRSRPGTKSFLEDAVKGVKDIMRQQISQGRIGDMSRVARISATCFVRGREGGTSAVTRRSRVMLNNSTGSSVGNPAMRCIMVLCQASQQAALDAHRVGSTESAGIDLVSCLLRGRAEGGSNVPQDTIFILKGTDVDGSKARLGASWGHATQGGVVLVAKDDALSSEASGDLVELSARWCYPGFQRGTEKGYAEVLCTWCTTTTDWNWRVMT